MIPELIADLARILSRDDFAKRFACWFLVILDGGEEEPPSSFETVDASAVPRPFAAQKAAAPTILAIAKAEGNPYPDRISVGRARNCDIVLRHASVSKLHAHILPRPDDKHEIVDVGSQVGTRVNGHPLTPNVPQRIAPGFILLIGRVAARVVDARVAWELLKAQERLEEGGSIPPPRSSVPGSAPAPRSSAPGSAPPPRPSAPSPVPPPRSSVSGSTRRG